ncbi:IS200/IS605 family transposase [bacterium]|nr:IS200/IS605 family transposase [bacterium]MBU1652571.1 IS200/IS605 family transposase [bacterium]
MSYTQLYYHIVFTTKRRNPVLLEPRREELFKYIWGTVNKLNCQLYRINGIEDHIHVFCSIHPKVCLADFVKSIKGASWNWIRSNEIFPEFTQWQNSYSAFTHSNSEKDRIIQYIINQQEHHKDLLTEDELQILYGNAGLKFDKKFLL